jgi:hypothetical protein
MLTLVCLSFDPYLLLIHLISMKFDRLAITAEIHRIGANGLALTLTVIGIDLPSDQNGSWVTSQPQCR